MVQPIILEARMVVAIFAALEIHTNLSRFHLRTYLYIGFLEALVHNLNAHLKLSSCVNI
jgi:hypothetical protein